MEFLKRFAHSSERRSEIGAVCPSSQYLSDLMISEEEISDAKIIVELWAGTGVFTQRIFDIIGEAKKEVFIVEKDREFYEKLIERFPDRIHNIINADVRELEEILKERGMDSVDLVISGLPFRSLGADVFVSVMAHFLGRFSHTETIFRQFSYFPSAGIYRNYFSNITKKFCFRNIPPAMVFTCKWYKKELE